MRESDRIIADLETSLADLRHWAEHALAAVSVLFLVGIFAVAIAGLGGAL